jgi:DNA-binding IclR family transcriptional regulator
VAEQSGDTVFLAVPSGPDALCIDRREGSFQIKAFTVEVGTKLPMGIGVGGLAMLSALGDDERRHVLAQNMPRLVEYGEMSPMELLQLVEQSRRQGFAFNQSRAPGVAAIGVAILGPHGEVAGSISIAAIESRLTDQRAIELSQTLLSESKGITYQLIQQLMP